jgi:hypothetical protein
MATARKSRYVGRHRAQELPVRRWLQVGAASAGVGAALLGWSLMGPQVDVAAADSTGQPSASGPAASPGKGPKGGEAGSSAEPSATPARNGAAASAPSSNLRAAAADTDDDVPARAERRSPSTARTPDRSGSLANPRAAQSFSVASRSIAPITRTPAAVNATTPSASGPSSILDRFTASTALSTRVASRAPATATVAEPSSSPLGAPVTFKFVYTKGAEYWTPARRAELEQSAASLAQYFAAPVPITITYEVEGENNPEGNTLAAAGSPLISTNPGFYSTVLQEKFISGLDLNGPAYDGGVTFNFANNWGLGYKVGSDDFDFVSTAEHELMHSFGFLSITGAPGSNTGQTWSTFDASIVNAQGVSPFGSDYRFNTAFNPNLIGWNGGMYLGGSNAVAAYGKLVPLFTPTPYSDGSSMSHLDDYTFAGPNKLMMTSGDGMGNGRRTLSPVEQGIMADLGYRVIFQGPAPYAPPAPTGAR